MENHDVNEYPLFAAGNPYAGKNSRLERSFRARQQLRDSKGRWIYMGGNLGLKYKLDDGTNIRAYGKNVGASEANPGFAQVYIQNSGTPSIPDGFYLAKGDKGRIYKAVLSKEQLAEQGIDLKDVADTDPELQPIADLIPIDAPEGWTKNTSGSYSTPDGDYTIEQNQDGKWELLQDEVPLGSYDNPGDAFADAADRDAEELISEDEKKQVADLRAQQDKLNEEFAKTENPQALARIEQKLEVLDGGIKDIIRNKPKEDVVPAEDGQLQVLDIANDEFLSNAPEGSELRTFFKYGDYEDSVHVIGTKNKDGNWDFILNPNEPAEPEFSKFEGEYTPKEAGDQFDNLEITKLPEAPVEDKVMQQILSEADKYKADFEKHQALDVEGFKVGDDTNHAFLEESPIGTEISFKREMDGEEEANITFTKMSKDQWMAEGHPTYDGVWNTEDLKIENDYYTIDKIGGEEAPEAVAEIGPKNLDEYKLVEGQKGSNKGGVYEGPDGDKVYVKFQDEAHANNEVLAAKLYDAAGVPAAQVEKGTLNGETVTYSPIVASEGSLQNNLENPDFISAVQDGFAVDAWLANWDVAGLNYDNILADEFGMPFRVDPGGALEFRAQGAPKGDAFGNTVTELETLTDPSLNAQAAKVFGSMTDEQKAESAQLLSDITDAQIDEIVASVMGDTPEAQALAEKLRARRADILDKLAPEATAAPEGLSPEIANVDFFKEDGSANDEAISQVVEALAKTEAPAAVKAELPADNAGYLAWEDWAFNAPVGTTVYSRSNDGTSTYAWTRTEDGWEVADTASGETVLVSPDGVVAIEGSQGKFKADPADLPEVTADVVDEIANADVPLNIVTSTAGTRVKDSASGSSYGALVPTVNNSVDAIFTPRQGGPQKAVFSNMEDAQIWLGDLIANETNSDVNVFTLKPVGEKDLKPTVHKGGNLNAASAAQISKVKHLLAGKDIDETRKKEIENILGKENLASGEIGMIIGELSKLPDVANPVTKPKEDAPTVSEVDNPQVNPTKWSDEPDANLIMQQVKADYPNAEEISDSDLLIASSTYTKTASGKSFKYDLIVRRTKKERFFAYVRETDMQTGEVRFSKVTKEVHSYQALSNKLGAAKYQITSGPDARLWFQKRTNIENSIDKAPTLDDPIELIEGTNVPKSEDEAYNELAKLINHLVNSDAASSAVIEALADAKGVDPEVADNIYDIIVGNSVANMGTTPDGSVPEAPHVSYDGKTQVKVGDVVDWTDNNPNSSTYGQVFRGTVSKLRYAEDSKGYKYSDKVYAIFPEYNAIHGYPSSRQRSRVTSGLIVTTKEAPMSSPFVPKAKEAKEQEKVTGGFFDVPANDAVNPKKPKVSAPAKPADVKYDTEGTSYVETPAGDVSVPSTPEDLGTILASGETINIKPNQLQVNDYLPILPDDVSIPTMAKITEAEKQSDGSMNIKYIYINKNKEVKEKTVTYTSDFAQEVNLTIKRPAAAPEVVTAADLGPAWKSDPATPKQLKYISNLALKKKMTPEFDAKVDAFLSKQNPTKGEASEILDVMQTLKDEGTSTDGPSLETVGESLADLKESLQKLNSASEESAQSITEVLSDIASKQKEGYGGYGVKPIEVKDVVYTKSKKNAPFTNVAKMSAGELEPGDIVPIKSYSGAKTYLQILSVEKDGNYYEVVSRVVSDDPQTNGEIRTKKVWYNNYYKNVKRPTQFAGADYVIEAAMGDPMSGFPFYVDANPDLKVKEKYAEVFGEAVQVNSKDYFDALGAPSTIDGAPLEKVSNYSQADIVKMAFNTQGVAGTSANGPVAVIPGSVVRSLDKGSSGIVIDTDQDKAEVTVAWLTGSKAGNVEGLLGKNVRTTPYWATPEQAKGFGVEVSTDKVDAAKKVIADKIEDIKVSQAEKILKEAQIAEWNKKKATATVAGTGAAPVEVTEDLGWDYKVSDTVDSLATSLEKITSGEVKNQFGLSALVDSGEIEDNKVRITKVVTADGQTRTRIQFTATSWAADKQADGSDGMVGIADKADGVVKSNGIQYPKFEMQPDGTLKQVGTWSNSQIDSYLTGSTYRVPLTAPDGTEIGYYLLHRGNKDDSKQDFSKSSGGASPLSYHNKVDVYLDSNVSPDVVQYALSQIGVKASRPATQADIQVTIENKMIDLLGLKMDGSVNYEEPFRSEILADIEKRYGIKASDVTAVQDGTDIFFLMPESFGKMMAEKTDTEFFNHGWKSSNLGLPGEQRADFIFRLLTETGLRPTTARWAQGINVSGMSSSADGYNHGASYVYTSKNGSGGSDFLLKFDAAQLLRRMDLYANGGDNFGKKGSKTPIEDILSSNFVYEILFKDTISWADLAKLEIDSATRAILYQKLLDAGITKLGERPIEDILGVKK